MLGLSDDLENIKGVFRLSAPFSTQELANYPQCALQKRVRVHIFCADCTIQIDRW